MLVPTDDSFSLSFLPFSVRLPLFSLLTCSSYFYLPSPPALCPGVSISPIDGTAGGMWARVPLLVPLLSTWGFVDIFI